MTNSNERQAADVIGILLHETAHSWRIALDKRLRPLGLSQAKWRALMILGRAEENITQRDLAERLGVEGPTLVRLLDRLEADDWVERRACTDDRRSKRIHLRPRARDLLKQIETIAADLRRELLSDLKSEEVEALADMLTRIRGRAEDRT
ncbi:MarR family transcriptional regulator [Azospirillum sp. SYSU D00513]|uniref:MarR family winged helix-turn-helix transcriptional regulator n=1 Tax=Azospirillum sp. SYSU D00513 TaxID=2812561 RepID=UPI001A966023|nr:MarR family transcriptional regulator [Azospirillum sp. SYSU D00513]